MILNEIMSILNINLDDPKRGMTIIETITKMEKILQAVPWMENFISEIAK